MTKVMVILSSTCSGLQLWSVNHTLLDENFDLKVFKNIKFLGEIFDNWTKDLSGKKSIQDFWILLIITLHKVTMGNHNTVSVISHWAHFNYFHL